jgi:hypothetical protein
MFADSFWPNLLAVVLGQIAAWGYVRTGLLVRGALLMVVGLAAADVALVARFAFSHTGAVYVGALLVLQVWSLAELVLFVVGRRRHANAIASPRRAEEMRDAGISYLRDELEDAEEVYRRLARRDAWDVEAALGLATVLARRGREKEARSWLRKVAAIDIRQRWADVVELELERLPAAGRPSREGAPRIVEMADDVEAKSIEPRHPVPGAR